MIDIICNQLLNNKIGIIEHDTLPGIVAKATEENAKRIQQIKERSESKGLFYLYQHSIIFTNLPLTFHLMLQS